MDWKGFAAWIEQQKRQYDWLSEAQAAASLMAMAEQDASQWEAYRQQVRQEVESARQELLTLQTATQQVLATRASELQSQSQAADASRKLDYTRYLDAMTVLKQERQELEADIESLKATQSATVQALDPERTTLEAEITKLRDVRDTLRKQLDALRVE